MVNKDKPVSWKPYKASLCMECYATCCTMPLEVQLMDIVNLELVDQDWETEPTRQQLRKIVKNLQKKGVVKSYRESTGLFLIETRPNGDCIFLNKDDRKCSVYQKRPQVCKKFPENIGLRKGFCPYIRNPSKEF